MKVGGGVLVGAPSRIAGRMAESDPWPGRETLCPSLTAGAISSCKELFEDVWEDPGAVKDTGLALLVIVVSASRAVLLVVFVIVKRVDGAPGWNVAGSRMWSDPDGPAFSLGVER